MQRVARQAVYAERRALQKREQIEKSKKRRYDKEQKVNRQRWRTAVGRLKRDAMAALKTDVELGDLAPRRDIGRDADTFATMPDDFRMGPIAHPNVFRRLYDKRHQATTNLFRSYKVDDKVIVVDGIGQGKIGYVKDVVWDTQKVRLAGMLEADSSKPDWWFEETGNTDRKNNLMSEGLLLDMHNIRLLQRVDGRDVIVDRFEVDGWEHKEDDELVSSVRRRNVYEGDEMRSEVVPKVRHLKGIVLDDPGNVDTKDYEPEYLEKLRKKKAYPSDSLGSEVELRTLVPDLQREPFPASVIDELRSPFGKHRTRHDEEYMKYMLEKDEKKEVRKKAVTLMELPTPGMYGKNPGTLPEPKMPPIDVLKMLGETMLKTQGEKAAQRAVEGADDPRRLLTRQQRGARRMAAFEAAERERLLTGKLLAKWNIGAKPKPDEASP